MVDTLLISTISQARLLQYLSDNGHGFPGGTTGLVVKQFSHGQSNPTYLIEVRAKAMFMHFCDG